MPNLREPELPSYEERLRARESASRRLWAEDQRRRAVDAGARARAQRRHDWRQVDPSAAGPRPPRVRRPPCASPSTLLALEVAGAGLAAAHGMVGALLIALAWGSPVPGRVWAASAALAFLVGVVVAFVAWPGDRRAREGLSHPVERVLVGFAAGSALGFLWPALWLLASNP